MVRDSNDEINFPHKLLLSIKQVSRIHKALSNNSSANIKLSINRLSKIVPSGGFLIRLLGPLFKTGLPLMKNVAKSLAKWVLIPLGLTAAASETDTAIQKNIFGSGMTTLIISNEVTNDMMKIVKFVEKSGLLIKRVSKTIKNDAK